MSQPAIQVQDLSKRYPIGAAQGGAHYRTFREALMEGAAAPLRHLRRLRGLVPADESIWALKDVAFEILPGEVLGIIGRNGAGKSTLLKILSRITEPTSGCVRLRGRVASLLEVGTGFHPELTGQENIYLNGAILGMKKAEIRGKLAEIMAFAEIEKFAQTPVKRYSSGMYMRLAFAVAAHLQPEILLVDEVLAVGDIAFQKKCMGRMESVARDGKTVALVSHSMSTIQALCSKAILLDGGVVQAAGPADTVVAQYLSSHRVDAAEKIITDQDHTLAGSSLRVRRIQLLNGSGNGFAVHWKQPIALSLDIEVLERIEEVAFGAGIRTPNGVHVFHVHQDDDGCHPLWTFAPGKYNIELTLGNDLRPGIYKLHIGADQQHLMLRALCAVDAITLEVLDHTEQGLVPEPSNTGLVNGQSTWKAPRRLR